MEEWFNKVKSMMETFMAPKSSFSLDSICPNPFNKSVDMNDFPRKLEIPQYDKYDKNGDPSDHVH